MLEIGTTSGRAGGHTKVAGTVRHDVPDDENASALAGRTWRNVLTIAVVVCVILGTFAWTDDAWPFAPFRMFADATKPTGRVVRVSFRAELADGSTVELDALDFGLRRAEVEGQLDSVVQDSGKLRDLAESYNDRVSDPRERIDRLEMLLVGSRLVDGVPVEPVEETIGEWRST